MISGRQSSIESTESAVSISMGSRGADPVKRP